jgi:hypothetical protein
MLSKAAAAMALGMFAANICPSIATAAEGGHGVYLLGLKGPAAGVTPTVEGFFLTDTTYWYQASNGANRPFPVVGGQTVANVRATVWLNLPSLTVMTPIEIFGGRLGINALIPLGGPNVDATATIAGIPTTLQRHDSASTYGDPAVSTFIGWHSGHFHWTVGVTGFFPMGDYQQGALANVANHRGAADFNGALTWLDPAIGLDVSLAAGYTTNWANTATNYRTGNELHIEGAITQNFSPEFSLGVVGYFYDQLTGDSGSGATLGKFKGRVAALGGSAGYNFKIADIPVSTRLKVYREFDVQNRLQGTAGYFTISLPLYVVTPPAATRVVSK